MHTTIRISSYAHAHTHTRSPTRVTICIYTTDTHAHTHTPMHTRTHLSRHIMSIRFFNLNLLLLLSQSFWQTYERIHPNTCSPIFSIFTALAISHSQITTHSSIPISLSLLSACVCENDRERERERERNTRSGTNKRKQTFV